MKLVLKAVVFIAAIYITDWLLVGIAIKTIEAQLLVALALVTLNIFIKPIIKFFTFPITLMSLGLFPLVLNTVFILLIAYFVDGFEIIADTYLFEFAWAFIFGLLLTIVNVVLDQLIRFFT